LRRVVEFDVAVAIVGREEDNDGPEPNGSCQEQIEKVLERNMRRSWERKERERAIWEDMFRERIIGVIVIGSLFWSTSAVAVVDVENEEVLK
jgi:hypothetical protein